MNKLLKDKSFWIILSISVISLVVLSIGVVFLTGQNAKEFYSSGYIISSTATGTDKYYFDDNTVYKENVFDEYVFSDVDSNEVSTSKDNFIHYTDNSLSFMKNGVILDLDNFNKSVVPYYNITDKSIIKYNNGGYYIETADKTLVFGNFLGRITDNKYIVIGSDVGVKLAGNDTVVKGDYFEILFVENGIVKIENQESSYQTICDGTVIYIGDNIKINLGDKSVVYGDEIKLNLSELTIDGNENIDIVPEGIVDNNEDDDTSDGTSGSGTGDGTDIGTDDDTVTGEGSGTGTSEDGTDGEITTILKKEVSVNLIEASSDVNSIMTSFQVIDTVGAINGNLIVTLVNTTTGEVVYGTGGIYDSLELVNVTDVQYCYFNNLNSDSNYILTISDLTGVQYFQKSFRTDSLDLKLVRELVTDNSLSYSLDFGVDSDIVSADISLFDEDGNERRYTVKNGEDTKVTFDELSNNTIYKVVVDNVVINNVQYGDVYKSETSDITLKKKPILGNVYVETNDNAKMFTLSMDKPIDPDNAIVKYTYEIYKNIDIEGVDVPVLVYSFTSTEYDDEIVKLDAMKELYGNTLYSFKVVVKYFDNYRYNEIETLLSDTFAVESKPTITFKEDVIEFDRISGTVDIDDVDCMIPFEGRQCNDSTNNFVIRYYGGGSSTKNTIDNVVVDSDNQTLFFDLNGLQENTRYYFEVYADIDWKDGNGLSEGQYLGGFTANTTGISALMIQNWSNNNYSYDVPISVSAEMVSTSTDSSSIDKLHSITFNLYSGDVSKNIDFSTPIASYTVDENVIGKFYNQTFTINSSSFEYIDSETKEVSNIINLDVLKVLSGGKLSSAYTIEVTDAFDETGTNEFSIVNNIYVYSTPAILLLEDSVSEFDVYVDDITNIQTKSGDYVDSYGASYNSNLDDEIVRGYKITAKFDRVTIENKVGYNSISSINFYVKNSKGKMIKNESFDIDDSTVCDGGVCSVYFFLGDGTDYATDDNDLRRGNTYTFSFDLNIDDDSDSNTDDLVFPSTRPTSDEVTSVKQEPLFKLYIDDSTKNTITYKYRVYDYDNALSKEEDKYYMYYNYEGAVEGTRVEYVKDGSLDTFTLSGLSNSDIYTISYYRAINKNAKASEVKIGSYFFDGYYDGSDYNLGYKLDFGNFDNRLKVIIYDNEFLDRVSAYLLTLEADGEKYQSVVTSLSQCDSTSSEETYKCIIVDYKDISSFKGKDVTVTLDAFYDTGYVGFSQNSLIGSYFESLGLVDSANASHVGFIYQTTGTSGAGQYFYAGSNGYSSLGNTPIGILGYELATDDNFKAIWKLSTSNMINVKDNKFVSYGDIVFNNSSVISTSGSINLISEKLSVNPKVLDKVSIQSDDSSFKFTSITPKVSAVVKPLINGATMNINLSIDESMLETDFIKTDGKYNFYIDVYQKSTCSSDDSDCSEELVLVKTVMTDYDNLSEVTFDGLNPDTKYYYKISADMNKNGDTVKTYLFDYNRTGYVEFQSEFNTLNKDKVFNRVTYGYTSSISDETYSSRKLTITAILKTNVNFDVKFELYDIDGNLEFDGTILNENIVVNGSSITAKFVEDITGNDFVFGTGYHNLVITAITTEGKELELYNAMLSYDSLNGMNFDELDNPTFGLSQNAFIDSVNGEYDYGITYNVTVTDIDKVVTDGIYYIELQNSAYNNACSNVNDCRATVNIKEGTCSFDNGTTSGCSVISKNGDSQEVSVTFRGLQSDTNYVIYVYANTYRNNLSLAEKEGLVYVRKSQYTKSELGFSLGAVTPTAVSENSLVITFAGASNLINSLVGIDYDVTVQGGGKVTSGSLGTTDTTSGTLTFGLDADKYPTITIPISSGSSLGLNNYIIITYYYKDSNGNIVKLKIGENTSYQYTVKNES